MEDIGEKNNDTHCHLTLAKAMIEGRLKGGR
jgi:hypothetical protein